MDRPPFVGGLFVTGVKETLAVCKPDWLADTPVGAFGVVAGTIAADGLEAGPVPAAFVAVTVKV
jgi:hypothetical protein